ncbi:MAG: serine/threonine protein phosphatase [Archaeoglobus sp.]|nr:serine/threonine protein phosphatase [Archaeoglobus sp.]
MESFAGRIPEEDFLEEVDRAISKLPGKKFVRINFKRAAIIGDTHGDLPALKTILKLTKDEGIIFLGDYGDRGIYGVSTYYEILKLFNERENVVLLKGNHESDAVIPHELPEQLNSYFNSEEPLNRLRKLWEKLPISAGSEEYWFVHGGVPTGGKDYREDFSEKDLLNPSDEDSIEMLWNDPWEKEENGHNYLRGVMYFFGKRTTRAFLESLDFKVIIRSHQPDKILMAEQDGMVVTVGSCMQPYGLSEAAFLRTDFTERIRDGSEVVKKFGVFI